MGPDPFNMPSFGAQSAQQNSQQLGQAIGQAAPLAPQWHGLLQHEAPQQVFNQPAAPKSQGVLANFTNFLGHTAGQIGHFVAGAGKAIGGALESGATSVVRYPEGIYKGIADRHQIDVNTASTQAQADQLNNLHSLFKGGKISKVQYQTGLHDLMLSENKLINDQKNLDSRINIDKQNAYKATVDAASAIITVATLGDSSVLTTGAKAMLTDPGVATASKYLVSSSANGLLQATETSLKRAAVDKAFFEALTPAAQNAVRTSVIEATQAAGNRALATQIARGAVINLAFKAPLNYTALSSTGTQLYNELDQAKYGAAVRTMAFNSLLLLLGPIGHALQYGVKGSVVAMFGENTFWDKLSVYYGDGSANGFAAAASRMASKMAPEDAKVFFQQLSDVAATNMKAMGNNVTLAVDRFAKGMRNNYGFSLSQINHDAALQDMVRFSKWQKVASNIGDSLGLGNLTVGRLDARDKTVISDFLAPHGTPNDRLQGWEDWKTANPNSAAANSPSFDTQIKNILKQDKSSAAISNDIKSIKTSFKINGFPKDIAEQMVKEGYVPISPVKLEAPYEVGGGKFKTQFANNTEGGNDFFLKAKEPLPVLGNIGDTLTSMGLSPYASSQMVYYTFNNNLARNLVELNVGDVGKASNETQQQAADTMIKKLTNWAHDPTRGGINIGGNQVRPPIVDLRQLTARDIQAALGVSKNDAGNIKDAITQSMIEVPRSIRGLGDKAVDYARNIPGYSHYLSIQGAARFAWNPFFKIKLGAKTEALSQLESGGKMLTVPGVNTMIRMVAPDTYAQIQNTRKLLTDAGIFTKGPKGFGGTEAFSDVGAASSSLGHALLPSQERSISSLVVTQANRAGMPVEDFIRTNSHVVQDTVQSIVGYDKRSDFLNSPLTRTINYAFFPFRFNVKVASFMARALSRADTITQFGVLHGLYQGVNFLNSNEGQVWYAKNAAAITLLKYFTPLETLSSVAHVLGQQPGSVGDFGELGGLPFGWIPQLLDASGLTHIGATPYVSPTTGGTVPDYVPITDRGHLLIAIQDLIGSIFTYPGTTVGLPSKTSITRQAATFLTTGTTKSDTTDFNKVTPPIPAGLQRFSDAVKSVNGQQNSLTNNPEAQAQFVPKGQQPTPNPGGSAQTNPVQQVPQLPSPALTTPGKLSTSRTRGAKGTKLKKSQYQPALLPGQSSYGQL